ncbi:MAG: transposase [Cyclobacteriaceae bacterium]|nr:transposase [Cyclobacteriaceae bacterium]
MGYAYAIRDQQGQYFVTITVNQWVDIFTRPIYVDILLESIRYCQKNKGLQVYAWVIMSNHIHMIISCETGRLSDLIRDLKKFTSSKIVQAIEENKHESRK